MRWRDGSFSRRNVVTLDCTHEEHRDLCDILVITLCASLCLLCATLCNPICEPSRGGLWSTASSMVFRLIGEPCPSFDWVSAPGCGCGDSRVHPPPASNRRLPSPVRGESTRTIRCLRVRSRLGWSGQCGVPLIHSIPPSATCFKIDACHGCTSY